MLRTKRVVAICLIVLMAVQATGCRSWATVTPPVPEAVAQYPNRKVQVVDKGGGTITADSAKIDATTLIAYLSTGVDTIPLVEVKEVKIQKSEPFHTAALAAVIVGALVAILYGVAILICGGGECG